MEAIVNLLSSYALSEAQSDSINNLSLIPFYQTLAIMASEADSFDVMVLDCQMVGATIMTWPRVPRLVRDFTPEGHTALKRLKEQIKLRLPELSASEGAVVIIDPLTKVFATDILGGRVKFQASKSFLLELHHKIYKIHHAGEEETLLGNSVNAPGHELDPPKASATVRGIFHSICLHQPLLLSKQQPTKTKLPMTLLKSILSTGSSTMSILLME